MKNTSMITVLVLAVVTIAFFLLRSTEKKDIPPVDNSGVHKYADNGAGRERASSEESREKEKDTRIFGFLNRIFSSVSSEDDSEGKPADQLRILRENISKVEDLPGEVWIPVSFEEEDIKKQNVILSDIIDLGKKVRENRASAGEKKQYLELKAGVLESKIEHIRASMDAMGDMEDKKGVDQKADIEEGNKMLEKLEKRLESLKRKLNEVQ